MACTQAMTLTSITFKSTTPSAAPNHSLSGCRHRRSCRTAPPKSIRWLREAEADALIEAAAALPGAIGLADLITISLHTGMRCHELLVEVAEGVEIGLTGEPCGLSQLSGLPG